jgi:hypothetical protein
MGKSSDYAFVFDLWVRSKVDEEAELMAGGFQVIVNLGSMFLDQGRGRFDFQDDFVEADEIGNVLMLERSAFVRQWQLDLWDEKQALHGKLIF